MTLVLILLLLSVVISSASQAWVLGRPAPREVLYAAAWIASSSAQLASYAFVFDSLRVLPFDMLSVIAVTAVAVPAAALWVGAWRAPVPVGEPFLGRILAVLPIHVAVVLIGSLAGWVLLNVVWLHHLH